MTAKTVAAASLVLHVALIGAAHANPSKVAQILEKAGRSGVARGPKTIDNSKKRTIEAAMSSLASKTSGKAFAVILPANTSPKPYAALYDQMNLGPRDVLIVSNGAQWVVRCDGITSAKKRALLKAVMTRHAKPLERIQGLAAGIPKALSESQSQSRRERRRMSNSRSTNGRAQPSTPAAADRESGGWGGVLLLLFVAGGVGFVFLRRRQRDSAVEAAFKAALDPAESQLAEFYLGLDGLESHEDFDAVLSKATTLSSEIDAMKAKPPSRESAAKLTRIHSDARRLFARLQGMQGQ